MASTDNGSLVAVCRTCILEVAGSNLGRVYEGRSVNKLRNGVHSASFQNIKKI